MSAAQGRSAYAEWSIIDGRGQGGEEYGWWPEESARKILARRRERHAANGPFRLIRTTWTPTVEEVEE